MAMSVRRNAAVVIVVLATLVISLVPSARPARADSGSFNVSPGETKYVTFGTHGVNDLILWSVSVSTWSSVFTDWLQKPDGTHVGLTSDTWGAITDPAGEWKLGFAVDSSGIWSADVTYQIESITPSLVIASPAAGGYSNTATTSISGTFDGAASKVEVSLDNVHFVQADTASRAWTVQIQLAPGANTIHAKSTYTWGSYGAAYTANPITVTLDTTVPTVSVTGPLAGAHIRGDYADITWQSSDNIGVVSTEMKIDGMDWRPVTGFEAKHLWFSTGYHVVQIRVTDHAGNQAIGSVSFNNDNGAFSFGGPYYGLPTVAVIVGVILVGLFVALTMLKRRRAPAEPPPSQPPAAPPSTQ
jgi:hypothetical protein